MLQTSWWCLWCHDSVPLNWYNVAVALIRRHCCFWYWETRLQYQTAADVSTWSEFMASRRTVVWTKIVFIFGHHCLFTKMFGMRRNDRGYHYLQDVPRLIYFHPISTFSWPGILTLAVGFPVEEEQQFTSNKSLQENLRRAFCLIGAQSWLFRFQNEQTSDYKSGGLGPVLRRRLQMRMRKRRRVFKIKQKMGRERKL